VREYERGKLHDLRNLDQRTTQLDELCCRLLDDVAAEERTKAALQAENIALMQERRELETLRDELRAAIKAEAAEHNLEWVDEGGDDGLAPAA
jgi:hypothetical protein